MAENPLNLEARLSSVHREDDDYLREVVHDVNNNLMVIMAGCDRLELTDKKHDRDEIIQNIRAHIHSVSRLLNNLCGGGDEDKPVVMTQEELESLLKGIIPSLILVSTEKANIEIGPVITKPVLINTLLLHRILLQLIRNIAEVCHEDPTAFISARQIEGWCEVSVADNGPGLDLAPEEVFKPGVTSKKDQARRGYGLSAVAHAVKSWGGEYGVEDLASGKGCRFWVRFPLEGKQEP